ncbi:MULTISPECIES: hypothetical protein [Kamptonema]|nr:MULTISPECIES: hypothetical protein [Kamptonema]
MKSRTTTQFRKLFAELPEQVQEQKIIVVHTEGGLNYGSINND